MRVEGRLPWLGWTTKPARQIHHPRARRSTRAQTLFKAVVLIGRVAQPVVSFFSRKLVSANRLHLGVQ